MTTAKTFKKGDLVTYISDWDRKGTVYFIQAVVYSCGKKQMVLTDAENGNEMGRHFKPALGSLETIKQDNGIICQPGGTFPRMTAEEAEAACLIIAAQIIKNETEHFNHCLNAGHNENYKNAVRKDLAEIHEPRALNRTGTTL